MHGGGKEGEGKGTGELADGRLNQGPRRFRRRGGGGVTGPAYLPARLVVAPPSANQLMGKHQEIGL